ncbi:MAG TPA: PAS domain S-box protein [Mucilaginibacter sp.]|jgi:PAS domain S-box-containing protein|nr:PAS domain S-box protein [Mucilaginibacter sp.]
MDKGLVFLLNNSSDILCVSDVKGNIISINNSWTHFTGRSKQDSQGLNLLNEFHPEDKSKINEVFGSIQSLKNVEGVFARLQAKDKAFLAVNWSICFDPEDELIYAVGVYINEKLNIRDPYNISDKVQYVIANLMDGFLLLDAQWRINAFNPAFRNVVKMTDNELYGADFRQIDKLKPTDEIAQAFANAYGTGRPDELQYYDSGCKGWLQLNIYPYKGELLVFIKNISYDKIEQLILALENRVLELNFQKGYPLSRITDELLTGIESIFPEMYCAILEVDEAQEKIYHLSGPRLPAAYNGAINGERIGPTAGSCGTAAYHRERVIVKDIENSPLWVDYKQYIIPYGFKACWSTPVISAQSTNVLATFAIYYDTIREPGKEELRMIDRTVNILRALIESKRNDKRIAEQTERLQDIASISSHNIRRPVATILGLTNLFDRKNLDNPLNKDVIEHLETAVMELDDVIHTIVEKTASI